ncbi:MAG: Gfo/Idh/MocA family oxidoreductase [Anaerolineales bacterium]|nr:Gfo/Idh/MocA family oxidoreductase [Anaerolineales bacterium]
MSGSKHRVAVIGAGSIAKWSHIPGFQRLDNCDVVAVCDVNEARARQLAEDTGVAQVFTDYEAMLEVVKPDIVVVATPNVFHQAMTEAALLSGAHVLTEKPLALNAADAEGMFELAERLNRKLSVGTHFRFTTPMQAAKAHVNAGFFGKIYAARTVWNRRNGIPGYGSWFTNKDLAGGGALLDIGVHTLDRALYLMNDPMPVSVSGATFAELAPRGMGLGGWGSDIFKPSANARYDVDDFATAFVRFANGAVLTFQVAWASNFPETVVTEIYGTNGGASIGMRDKIELYTMMNGQEVAIQNTLHEDKVGSYFRLIEHFVRAVDGDVTADIPTAEQAMVSVRIVDAIGRPPRAGARWNFKVDGHPCKIR